MWNKYILAWFQSGTFCYLNEKKIHLPLSLQSRDCHFKVHSDTVDQLSWHPKNPDKLATASSDKTVRLFDARSNKCSSVVQTKGRLWFETNKKQTIMYHNFQICKPWMHWLECDLRRGNFWKFLWHVYRKGGNFLTVSLMVEFHASCDENMSFIGYGISFIRMWYSC